MTEPTTSFDTVLVANRGEIACRVLRSARAEGFRTVAVHSDADADAPHVRLADDAVRIGPAPARESYLDIDAILEAARESGAQAIHPGYGFLAENAVFARACADAGLVFVGPTPDAIELMGDKAAAKHRMHDAGVPLLPGFTPATVDERSDDRLLAAGEEVGFPLMVKAAAGGGGKGMRLVAGASELPDALQAARREASAAFGDDTLILERALLRPRHVEIQVLADTHGHVIALGERDCSVQRRHQKVVEEAPSPALDAGTRTAMQDAAVTAAREIGYVGAGTVEFLLGEDGTFAFLEMNTRLQVEHPVTELVTGLDLVAWQLRIARGHPLTVAQDEVRLDGHAIEVRLYAEDPASGYLPQTGTVHAWRPPTGAGIRVDAGIHDGSVVTADYDPMLAKIVAHGRDRDEARRRLADALDHTSLLGVTTNRAFLSRILRHDRFASGDATTAFLQEHDLTVTEVRAADLAAVAGWWHLERTGATVARTPGLAGWTNAAWLTSRQRLQVGDDLTDVVLRSDGPDHVEVGIGDQRWHVERRGGRLLVDGRATALTAHLVSDTRLLAHLPHLDLDVRDVLQLPPDATAATGAGVLSAPMHGHVVAVPAAAGATVAPGDPVVVLEAMKMEHVVRADVAGTVTETAAVGDQVGDRQVVARIDPDEQPDTDPTDPGSQA